MSAVSIEWEDDKSWAAAVAAALRPYAIPPLLLSVPAVAAAGSYFAFLEHHLAWGFLAGLAAVGSLVGLAYRAFVVAKRPEYLARKELYRKWATSVTLRLVWDHWKSACDGLKWFRVVEEVVQTEEDDGKGGKRTIERVEKHREYAGLHVQSEEPEGEVLLVVATTSGIVSAAQIEGKASVLADYLGLNGWNVEVSPHPTPGHIVIRLARFSPGEIHGRVRIED